MRIAFIASLMVNVFLAAAILTGVILKPEPPEQHRGGERPRDDGPEDTLIAMHHLRVLDEDQRKVFWEMLRERRTEGFELFGSAEEIRRRAEDILAADEFDREAFEAAARELEQINGRGHGLFTEITADYMATLPAEDRQRIAAEMRQLRLDRAERFRKWRESRGKEGGERPGPPPGPGPDGPPPERRD